MSRSPGSPPVIPVVICRMRLRGGSPRYERTSNSGPRRLPVLVCLDDLHWASPATLAALRALPRDLKRHPVAWLLARSSTPQRARGLPVRPAGEGRCRPGHLGPAGSGRGGGHAHRRVRRAAGPGPGRPGLRRRREPLASGRADRRPARRSRRAGHRRTRRAGVGPAAAADSPPRAAAARWPQPAGPAAAGDGGGAGPGVPAGRRGRDARPDPGHAAARGARRRWTPRS